MFVSPPRWRGVTSLEIGSEDPIMARSWMVKTIRVPPKESSDITITSQMAGDRRCHDECYLASIFGTLLSSQGSDAHRIRPFGLQSGQPF
jgi:hypothetical protein